MDLWQYKAKGCALVGFRLERDYVDQIFTLKKVLEHGFKYLQLHVSSSCFRYSIIDRTLWSIMEYDYIPEKIIRLIKVFFNVIIASVYMGN